MRIGETSIERIGDLDPFALGLDFLFPGASLAEIEEHRGWLAPQHIDFERGEVLLAVQSHLVRHRGLNILIDTCVGEDKPRPRRADWDRRRASGFLQRLAFFGLGPGDIDIVLCTHLHADHVGWNTRLVDGRWVPTFPNARYLIGARELGHWIGIAARAAAGAVNHGSFEDSVAPVIEAGQSVTVDDGHEIAKGLTVTPLPGHTVGQVGVRIEGARRAIFCGDAIHSPVQIARPEWSSAFCEDRALAEQTRRALIEESVSDGTMLIPAHLRGACGMKIERRGARWKPVMCGCDA